MYNPNLHEHLPDKDVIDGALNRTIRNDKGELLTNFDFALHLFYCARDMLPFIDALNLYGYTKKSFDKKLVSVFKQCYNIGVSHKTREITAKLANGQGERLVVLDTLQRVYNLYADPKEEASTDTTVEFMIRQKDKRNLKGLVK